MGSLLALLSVLQLPAADLDASSWPSWRGAAQDGRADVRDAPTEWMADPAKNLKWQVALPGRGASTPVLLDGDRIALTAGIDGRNGIVCYAADGTELWKTPVGPLAAGKHKKASGANPSVAVGREHLFAYFKSGELAALTPEGEIAWTKNLAETFGGYDKDALWWDLGTSPVTVGDFVVIAVMQSGPSFLVALDQATGEVAWKTDRLTDAPVEAAQAYTTPVVGRWGGRDVLFTAGADTLTCHAVDGGAELWRVGGMNPDGDKYFRSISSPVLVDGPSGDTAKYLLVPYSRGETIRGFRIDPEDATAPTEPLWLRTGLGSDVPTPTGRDGFAFIVTDKGRTSGLVTTIDVTTGKTVGTVQLPKAKPGYSASPVLAGELLYLLREDGTTFVVSVADPKRPTLVATSPLFQRRGQTDAVVATPVLSDGRVLIRTSETLYCFGE